MKKIDSVSNEIVKELVKLQQAKYRSQKGLCVVEGHRAIETFINSKRYVLDTLYITFENLELAKTLISKDKMVLVSPIVMNKISSANTPSGLLAVFKIGSALRKNLAGAENSNKLALSSGVVLAGISDPGNMGTLIRTAAALNTKNVIIIDGADCWSPKVIQATAGTISLVNIIQTDWKTLLENKNNLKLIGLVVTGGKNMSQISKEDLKNSLIIIGSEAHGLGDQILKDCDELVTLEMPGNTESLNAAVAGSIAMYLASIK